MRYMTIVLPSVYFIYNVMKRMSLILTIFIKCITLYVLHKRLKLNHSLGLPINNTSSRYTQMFIEYILLYITYVLYSTQRFI